MWQDPGSALQKSTLTLGPMLEVRLAEKPLGYVQLRSNGLLQASELCRASTGDKRRWQQRKLRQDAKSFLLAVMLMILITAGAAATAAAGFQHKMRSALVIAQYI